MFWLGFMPLLATILLHYVNSSFVWNPLFTCMDSDWIDMKPIWMYCAVRLPIRPFKIWCDMLFALTFRAYPFEILWFSLLGLHDPSKTSFLPLKEKPTFQANGLPSSAQSYISLWKSNSFRSSTNVLLNSDSLDRCLGAITSGFVSCQLQILG